MKTQQTTFNNATAFEIVNEKNQRLFEIVFSTQAKAETYIDNLTDQQYANIE
jgi:hypothetical protein